MAILISPQQRTLRCGTHAYDDRRARPCTGARVRDFGPKGRDRAAVCAGSPPLQTVVSFATEPKPDPGAAGGTPEPAVHEQFKP